MAIDFEKMEKFLLEKFPDEEEKKAIHDGIEKLKKMSKDEYRAFLVKIDTFIYDDIREAFLEGGDEPQSEFQSVASKYFHREAEQRLKTFLEQHPEINFDSSDEEANMDFFSEHPEFDSDSDEYSDALNDFLDDKIFYEENKRLKEDLIDKAYNNLADKITDNLRLAATSYASEEFELHPGIIQYLELPHALPAGFLDQ